MKTPQADSSTQKGLELLGFFFLSETNILGSDLGSQGSPCMQGSV